MKKLMIGLAAMMMLGCFSFQAQDNAPAKAPGKVRKVQTADRMRARVEQKTPQAVVVSMAVDSTSCAGDGCCVFESMELSDSQKARLQEVMKKYRDDRKALYDSSKELDRASRDSLRRSTRDKEKDLKREQLDNIRSILTSEQYIQFLEESYLNGNQGREGRRGHGGREGTHRR